MDIQLVHWTNDGLRVELHQHSTVYTADKSLDRQKQQQTFTQASLVSMGL